TRPHPTWSRRPEHGGASPGLSRCGGGCRPRSLAFWARRADAASAASPSGGRRAAGGPRVRPRGLPLKGDEDRRRGRGAALSRGMKIGAAADAPHAVGQEHWPYTAGMVPAPRGGNEAMIKARGLTKPYGGKLAADQLSFTVEPGRIPRVPGPNAAGQ